jgi:hypothetical protein
MNSEKRISDAKLTIILRKAQALRGVPILYQKGTGLTP